ncbi:hypothetical protein SprV_0200898300 [Sparganum proliferum]
MGRDLRVGVISPYRCHVFGDLRPEQSSIFSDVVALSDITLRRSLLVFIVADVLCTIHDADFIAAFDLQVDCCHFRLHGQTASLTV